MPTDLDVKVPDFLVRHLRVAAPVRLTHMHEQHPQKERTCVCIYTYMSMCPSIHISIHMSGAHARGASTERAQLCMYI